MRNLEEEEVMSQLQTYEVSNSRDSLLECRVFHIEEFQASSPEDAARQCMDWIIENDGLDMGDKRTLFVRLVSPVYEVQISHNHGSRTVEVLSEDFTKD